MGDNIYAVTGLTRKRAERAGQMLILQEQVRQLSVGAPDRVSNPGQIWRLCYGSIARS